MARRSWPELVGDSWEHARAVLTAAGKDAQMVPQVRSLTRGVGRGRRYSRTYVHVTPGSGSASILGASGGF